MNIATARVAFRERALVDVLDLALRFVVVHAAVYAKVAAAVLLPAFAVAWAASAAFGWVAGWAVAVALASLVTLPFTLLASRLVFEDVPRARDVLRASWQAVGSVVVLRIVSLVAFVLGATFFVVPAFWLGATLVFLDEVKLLEGAPLASALGRTQRLASSSFGGAMLAYLLLLASRLAVVVLADVAGRTMIGELFQFRPPASLFATGGSVLGLLGLFAVAPFFATARFFAYLDVRTRTEGWDVQTRFAALAARAAEETRVKEAA